MSYDFDPELKAAIPNLPVPDGPVDISTMRELMASVIDLMNENVDVSDLLVEDHDVPGREPTREVLVRTYTRKDGSGLRPGILDIHGGGFTTGTIALQHGAAANMAREVEAVVATVEYRLAPEYPFPAGLEDCYLALEWLNEHSDDLGVDAQRIAVVGSSAGGGLAAGLALLTRDRGGPALCFQYLGIPELDDRLETTSMRNFVDTPVFSRNGAVQSWQAYLGDDRARCLPLCCSRSCFRPAWTASRLCIDDGVRPTSRRGHSLCPTSSGGRRVGRTPSVSRHVSWVGHDRRCGGIEARSV